MDRELTTIFELTRASYEAIVQALIPLAERIAVATVDEVLPGARTIEVRGEVNEDWIPILRIQRVRDAEGLVLLDVGNGHESPLVEAAIDAVNTEYLDLLIDLTGDTYMGSGTVGG